MCVMFPQVVYRFSGVMSLCVTYYLYLYYSDGGRHRGGRGHDGSAGATVKICKGPFKGYRGRVVEFKGTNVRVELESQMKVVTGKSTYS